jgi:imidazole glycerol-phosphate synthase subunit HisF
MLKTRLIPCMLFNGFSLVKTIQFDAMRNLGSPVQMARVHNSRNVDELIFIDLKATEEDREPLYDIVREISAECFMPLAIGGGIHTLDSIRRILAVGADKVCINSEAIRNPAFISQAAQQFGNQCIVASIDVKKIDNEHLVHAYRGKKNTGLTAVSWAQELERRGVGEIFLTSIDQDGMMKGYDLDLIRKVSFAVKIPVICCGGAGKVQDIIDAVILGNASAVALASMFHYSGHTANSIKQRMLEAGIPVRMVGSP